MSTHTIMDPPTSSLQLYVDVSPDGQVDSVTPVRWCIGLDLIEYFKRLSITDAKVLFVILQNGVEVGRKMVPVANEMTYLSFTRPGTNEVKAIVVYNDPTYLMRQEKRGDYLYNVLADGEIPDHFTMCSRLPGEDSISVNVPAQMFAKAPNKIMLKVAGVLFDKKPKDQCDLRRKFLISIPLIPFMAIVGVLGGIVSITISAVMLVVFAFLGFRGISASPLWHPYSEGPARNIRAVDDNRASSIWIHEPGVWPSQHFKHPVWWILNPVCIGAFIALGFAAQSIWHLHWPIIEVLLTAMIVPTVLVVLAIFVGGAVLGWYNGNASKRRAAARKRKDEEDAKFYRELEALACNGTRVPSLEALPRQKRTFTLRYASLKKKVCRPYAK